MNRPVVVHTDSKYSIDCVTNWFVNWRKRGWKNAQGKPVENKELIEEILAIVEDRHKCDAITNFEWVKGHAGNTENEEADRLAVAGALENKQRGIQQLRARGKSELTTCVDEDGNGSLEQFLDAQEDVPMT
jgi:ribonuclease HI